MAARLLTSVPPHAWNRMAAMMAPLLPPSLQFANVGDKLHKGAGILDSGRFRLASATGSLRVLTRVD